jgi:predicted peptidase
MAASSSSSPVVDAVDAITAHREERSGLPYLLYKPPAFERSKEGRWPLLLFLHGAGESGDDPWELLSEGATGCPLVEIQNNRANDVLATQFVIVAPQTDHGWSAEMLQAFMTAISGSADGLDLRVDPKRMYATGVSMGGYGTWEAGTLGLFAAIAPVCGAGAVDPSSLGDTPVWAFHGANDIVVPVEVSDQMVEALRMVRFGKVEERRNAETGNVVKYTRYENAPAPTGWGSYLGHASWKNAYRGPELFEWMLKQQC